VEYGNILDTLPAHDDAVTCVCWRNNTLVTSSWDASVKVNIVLVVFEIGLCPSSIFSYINYCFNKLLLWNKKAKVNETT